MTYEAFILTEASRSALLAQFPPKYQRVFAHHVTHRFGVPRMCGVPYGEQTHCWFEVLDVLEADGIQVLLVAVAGKQHRPDGKRYHITWSLDPSKGWAPKDSNAVIAQCPQDKKQPILAAFSATFDYVD